MLRANLVQPLSLRGRRVHLVLGALLPLLFLVVDPAVFRTGTLYTFGSAYLGAYRAFGYVVIVAAAILLTRALFASATTELEAGMLYGAAGLAFLLGLVLLPLSLLGLVAYGLGILGLTPFVASWIYLRNAARQHAAKTGRLFSARGAAGIVLFVLVAISIQLLTNGIVRWSVNRVDRPPAQIALRAMSWLYEADLLVWQYQSSKSIEEKRRLALAFELMSEQDIQDRLERMVD